MVQLVVRVRMKLVREGREVETSSLANSGYESETPQILIPIKVAELLALWPPTKDIGGSVFETAGGPLRVWIASKAVKVKVVVADTALTPLAMFKLMNSRLSYTN